jgi:RimJ/RimL family protein N-acetyltransferase
VIDSAKWKFHGTEFTWLITVKPDGPPVGAVSCFPDGHRAEIGYVLNRQYWGKGYATEAARRVMEWMFDDGAVWRDRRAATWTISRRHECWKKSG